MLSGKRVIIAGAGPGLGSATAYLALINGASVVMVARNEERLRSLKAMLSKYGRVEAVKGDLSTMSGAEDAVKRAYGILGGIDGVVTVLGGYTEASISELTEDSLFNMLRVNLAAHLFTVKAAVQLMNRGSIVMVTAIWGPYLNWPNRVAYVASKAALSRVVETLASELLSRGIRVNAVAPGGIRRDFRPERDWRSTRSIGDSSAPPEDIANIIIWLLSDQSEWVNGAVIPADGGFRLRQR
ncbi:SDR family oxidoreductase [Caldivirga maquilingensis]|uniref:Short-chain dehydrogenase/reductase SDR n=1 Tax=Caldivirga maquilingensis (strain ATCC 700844 / DSM 13496 / JCM 10307 / IC-167) TaxID=397948 RepID=A8ME51_CALMQ|nr:SDR family oxidoreductase [Caldivirga maquilingensis]ABW02057.1 short-chain dehydrogenase/reductase SDR [Caldivirga maquilingensis IC-167]